jgi:hypothetical protein
MAALLNWLRLNWSLLALILGLTLVYVFLRNSPTQGINSLPALDQAISAGRPVVLEFYSNF